MKGGLFAALAEARSAEIARLAAGAARALGCDGGLGAAETVLRAGLLKLGGSMLGQLLSADPGQRGPRLPCGQGHEAEFTDYRDKVIDTVLGPVTLRRAWYHCAECKHGFAPRDAELGVEGTSLSPGLAAMNDIAAAAGPFAKAAGLLEDLAGVSLTVKRVERAAEASGAAQSAAVRERSAAIAGRKVVPMPPSPCPDMLYGAIDGTGVTMTAKEPPGAKARARTGGPAPARSSSPCSSPRTTSTTTATRCGTRESASYIATLSPRPCWPVGKGATTSRHLRRFPQVSQGWSASAVRVAPGLPSEQQADRRPSGTGAAGGQVQAAIEVELDLAVGRHVHGEQRGQAAPVGVAEPAGPLGLGEMS